jgi:imidazolonepropionase-like amidohydrolase
MNRRATNSCLALVCLALACSAHAGPVADMLVPSAGGVTTLRCGTLIDGRSATPKRDVAIRIEDGSIVHVGAYAPGSAGTVIDRSQDTCLPGLIDAHAHVLIKTDDYQVDHLRRSSGCKALRGLDVVQQMLRSGWTTVRILGDADVAYAHLDVRTAIQEGLFTGPRLTGAGHYLSITGGGGDLNFLGPEHRVVADGLVVDGMDALRKAVRTSAPTSWPRSSTKPRASACLSRRTHTRQLGSKRRSSPARAPSSTARSWTTRASGS